jgi:acetylglutamate kinase
VIVVKLGGEVIASPGLAAIANDLAELTGAGVRAIVVHGGGPQATRLQERLGQSPKRVAGRRITDEAALDVMKMVVAGQLNVDLCAALLAAGARPVGLHGASDCVIEAVKRPPKTYAGAGSEPIDLGLVGDVTAIGRDLVMLLVDRGYIPVLACLGAARDGRLFNINADIVANSVAAAVLADGLFLVSDVPGVLRDLRDPSSRIPELSVSQGRELIASGVVTKGMIPKLEESFATLSRGVRRIHIVGALGAGDLLREVRQPGAVGTALVPD